MKKLLLLIIPFIIFINIKINKETNIDYDPNYIYLFNGLNFAYSYGNIGHYDNPGTPTILFSAIVIKTTYKIRNVKENLPTDVLLHPQYYLEIIAWSFSVINCLLILGLGFIIYKITNEIFFGILLQSTPFFSNTILSWSFYNVSPEPFLFGVAAILSVLFLWKTYFNKSFGSLNLRHIKNGSENVLFEIDIIYILFGFIIGLGLASKINSIPLIFLPLFFIKGYKKIFIYFISIAISFIIFTLPIIHYYPTLFGWVKDIFFHSGRYGNGANEVFDLSSFINNFIILLKKEPVIIGVIFVSMLIMFKQIINKKFDIRVKILLALISVQLLDLIMVLKHFSTHYLIPIIPTIAINIFIIFQILNLSKSLKIVIITSLIFMCYFININMKKFALFDDSIIYISKLKAQIEPDCINIYSYGCNSNIYALKYGDDYALDRNTLLMEKLYGEQYFYNVFSKQLYNWKQIISLDTLIKSHKKLILYANEYYLSSGTPFKLKLISEGKYLIETNQADK